MVINHVSKSWDVHPTYSQAGDAYASWDTSGFKLLGRLAKSIHGQAPASTKKSGDIGCWHTLQGLPLPGPTNYK